MMQQTKARFFKQELDYVLSSLFISIKIMLLVCWFVQHMSSSLEKMEDDVSFVVCRVAIALSLLELFLSFRLGFRRLFPPRWLCDYCTLYQSRAL